MVEKNKNIAILIAVIIVGVFRGGTLVSGLITNNNEQNMDQIKEVQSTDTVVGTGDVAVAGKTVKVHYTGVFTSGEKFDSSVDRGVPFEFILGVGQVIKGWDIGVEGMKVGGKRVLVVPPAYGYGENDYGPIPGNSTLIFEVELLEVR